MALGRAFGFAFGHKENGAMFSHMSMMYAYSLYHRGYPEAGHSLMKNIYQHCQDFSISKMYPGIPEYIGPDGRGYYFYLTGSASWYLFTLITQVFGIRGIDGDLILDPKLMLDQFDDQGIASIHSHFAGRTLIFKFINEGNLPINKYRISVIRINGESIEFEALENGVRIIRKTIHNLAEKQTHTLEIELEINQEQQ
jgi:cellobiose phosphorylase